jgi:hypothetical protein
MQHLNFKPKPINHIMYTALTIINANNLQQKAYVSLYFEGRRKRIYSGRAIGLKIFPNRAKTIDERTRRLNALKDELQVLLETNNYPYVPKNESREAAQLISLLESLKEKTGHPGQLNESQKQKLRSLNQALTEFLNDIELPAD